MEAMRFSETSKNFHRTTPPETVVQNFDCLKL